MRGKGRMGHLGMGLGLWLAASWAQAGAASWSLAPVQALLCSAPAFLPDEPGDVESKEEIKQPGPVSE